MSMFKNRTMENETITLPMDNSTYDLAMFKYLFTVIGDSFGTLFSLLCVLVFARILLCEQQIEGHMFKFFLAKSLFDLLYLVIDLVSALYAICPQCDTSVHWTQVWYIWFYNYFEYILLILSGIFEIGATVDCYVIINRSLQCVLSPVYFIVFCATTVTASSLLYLYIFFSYRIKLDEDDHSFRLVKTEFFASPAHEYLDMAQSLIRDLLVLIVLVYLNILILFSLRSVTKRKRQLAGNSITNKLFVRRALHAERAKCTMIALICVNYTLGHGPMLVYKLADSPNSSVFWSCFINIASCLFITSYATPIFLYYFCNNTFKRYTLRTFQRISACLPLPIKNATVSVA